MADAPATPGWLAWVTALGSLATLATFVWSRVAERRKFANLVCAMTGSHVEDCRAVASSPERDWAGHHFHSIVVENGSDLPVRDVSVWFSAPGAVDVLPGGKADAAGFAVGAVPPRGKREVEIGHVGQLDPQFPVLIEVYFTDVRGKVWRRDEKGKLHRHRDWPRLWERKEYRSVNEDPDTVPEPPPQIIPDDA